MAGGCAAVMVDFETGETKGQCTSMPYLAVIGIYHDGQLVKRVKTDEKGEFEVMVAPGEYTVTGDDGLMGLRPTIGKPPEPQLVIVTVGRFSEVLLVFDSGIGEPAAIWPTVVR